MSQAPPPSFLRRRLTAANTACDTRRMTTRRVTKLPVQDFITITIIAALTDLATSLQDQVEALEAAASAQADAANSARDNELTALAALRRAQESETRLQFEVEVLRKRLAHAGL